MEAQEWWAVGSWLSAEEWQAVWSFATFVVALVAAIVALRQFRQNAQAQIEQTRPYVVVDFAAPYGGSAIFIEIRNSGLTAARDITLEWSDRPSISDAEAAQAMTRWVFKGPIPFLAPGRTIRYYLGPFPDDEHRVFFVEANYIGTGSRKWLSTSVLSFDQWAPAEVDRDPLHDIASHLKRIKESNEKAARHIERAGARLDVIADHFRQTPEYKKSASRSRIQQYERQLWAKSLRFRSVSTSQPKSTPDGE